MKFRVKFRVNWDLFGLRVLGCYPIEELHTIYLNPGDVTDELLLGRGKRTKHLGSVLVLDVIQQAITEYNRRSGKLLLDR